MLIEITCVLIECFNARKIISPRANPLAHALFPLVIFISFWKLFSDRIYFRKHCHLASFIFAKWQWNGFLFHLFMYSEK